MKVFRSKFSGLTGPMALAAVLLQSNCSESNPIGQTVTSPGKKDRQEYLEQNTANNEPDMTAPMPQESSNDYTGTIDPTLISAAYLACGKKDQAGTEIGCNVYTATDQRIAAAASTGSWIAKAGGVSLNRSSPGPVGIAFAALVPPAQRFNRLNPKITVSYSFTMGASPPVVKTFESNLGSMALTTDFRAFGQAQNFHTVLPNRGASLTAGTLSQLLSTIQFQRDTADNVRCTMRLFTQTSECSSTLGTGRAFNLRRLGPTSPDTLNFNQSNINSRYQTCESIANLCFAILCR